MSAEADCLFCKIVRGDIPTEFVAQGDDWVAFNDIGPQAPHHVLVIPKRHIATVNDAAEGDAALLGSLMLAARSIAAERGIAESGFSGKSRVHVTCTTPSRAIIAAATFASPTGVRSTVAP